MFLLKRPTPAFIARFLSQQAASGALSYSETGSTRATPPAGYNVDHHRVPLGEGVAAFTRAAEALDRWAMFDMDWVTLIRPASPVRPGLTVASLIHHYGFYSLNACRIVYTVDTDGPMRRYGFAYGTLREHGEQGEERFTIVWNRGDDSVHYDILAFSRPRHPLAIAGYPLVRSLQRRFAQDSTQAMMRAVTAVGPDLAHRYAK